MIIMKTIQIRNVSKTTAKKEIFDYMKNRRKAYVSDISNDLELDLDLVFYILEELESEGFVE